MFVIVLACLFFLFVFIMKMLKDHLTLNVPLATDPCFPCVDV